jgi:hypothetical protein
MRHFDEHMLTLYVLGARSVASEKETIKRHLAKCRGCRGMVEELKLIYADVENEMPGKTAEEEGRNEALVRVSRGIIQQPDALEVSASTEDFRGGRRVMNFARRHPLAAGASLLSVALVVFFAARGVWLTFGPSNAGEPSFVRINQSKTSLDVFDADATRLWKLPVSDASHITSLEARWGTPWTQVTDLEGDGRKEVVTAAPFMEGGKEQINTVRIFDDEGSLRYAVKLGRQVDFRDRKYEMFYYAGGILTRRNAVTHRGEIIAGARNYRSPYVVTRLSAGGENLGEYWHFGWLGTMHTIALTGEKHEVIVLAGVNEVGDFADSTYPAIVVLDPEKIDGKTESSLSRGFGYQASNAEVFYIRVMPPRFPIPPDSSLGKEGFLQMRIGQDSSMIFFCHSRTINGNPIISYTFDSQMRLRSVFLDDESRVLLQSRYLTDKSHGALDRFLKKAEEGVSYWDGHEWRKEPSRIIHSPASQ